MAEVTVVLPTFNRAHTLGRSVASLLGQDGVDLRVRVVDDGSTDDTRAVLAGLADPRLEVLAGPHAGIAAARNRGLVAVDTPYVAFHDSDDVALPGRLARPVAHLRANPELALVIQNGSMLPPEGEPDGGSVPWIRPAVARRLAARPIGVAEVFRWNLGQLQGMCFTRRSIEVVGPFDASFTILDDLDLVLRVTARFPAAFLDVPAFAYHRHAGGVSRDRERVRAESIALADKLVREHPAVLDVLGRRAFDRRQARRWARLAAMRAARGDAVGAGAALTAARALKPGSLRYRLEALGLWLRARR